MHVICRFGKQSIPPSPEHVALQPIRLRALWCAELELPRSGIPCENHVPKTNSSARLWADQGNLFHLVAQIELIALEITATIVFFVCLPPRTDPRAVAPRSTRTYTGQILAAASAGRGRNASKMRPRSQLRQPRLTKSSTASGPVGAVDMFGATRSIRSADQKAAMPALENERERERRSQYPV